jgi:hypothetical protein
MQPILTGNIIFTDDKVFVMDMIRQMAPVIILNLDEFDREIQGQNVAQGQVLLPPPEACMAEADGDVQLYDMILDNYYGTEDIIMFIKGIITSLHQGRTIFLYYPDLNPSESATIPKLEELWMRKFGIRIGMQPKTVLNDGICVIGAQSGTPNVFPMECACDNNYRHIWLNLMLGVSMDAYEFLTLYPAEMQIGNLQMRILFDELWPPFDDYNKNVEFIYDLSKKLKKKPETKIALHKL